MRQSLLFTIAIILSYPVVAQRIIMNPYATLQSELSKITTLDFSADDHLLAGDDKGMLKVWDLGDRSIVAQKKLKGGITFASFINDNDKVLILLKTGDIEIYNKDLSIKQNSLKTEAVPISASLDPNKHYLTVYDKSERIEVFDLKANMLFGKIDARKKLSKVKFIGFDRFSQQLSGISNLGEVYNWDPYRQNIIRQLRLQSDEFHGSKSVILSASSNDGSDLFVVGLQEVFIPKGGLQGNQQPQRKNMLIAYNWHDGRELKRIKINERPDEVALGPGPNHIAYITKYKDQKQVSLVSIQRSELDSRISLEDIPDILEIAESNDWLAVGMRKGGIGIYTLDRNETAEIKIIKPTLSRNYASNEVKSSEIDITGSILNSSKVIRVTVNGEKVDYDVTGNFSAKVGLRPGKNKVRVIATDTEDQDLIKDIYVSRLIDSDVEKLSSDKGGASLSKVALVVGNSNYANTAVLKNPKNDAIAMAELLRELDFDVIELEDGTYENMKEAVYRFGDRISNADVTIFYYAGHGIEIDGTNYLIPIDAKLSSALDVKLKSIPLKGIINTVEYANDEGLNMIILDACRNNPFPTGKRGGAGLAKVTPPSGTLIAYATDPGSTASDGEGENGLYTGELVKQMRVSQRIEDVFMNTRIRVEELSNGNQRPWEEARLKGIFYLK